MNVSGTLRVAKNTASWSSVGGGTPTGSTHEGRGLAAIRISGLESNTEYLVGVCAENKHGRSQDPLILNIITPYGLFVCLLFVSSLYLRCLLFCLFGLNLCAVCLVVMKQWMSHGCFSLR